MPFIYTPSLYGFTAAAVFFFLALIAGDQRDWTDALMWAFFTGAFAMRYMPKFVVFRFLGWITALGLLLPAIILFVVDVQGDLG